MGGGVAGAGEGVEDGDVGVFGEEGSEDFGLVELAFAEAGGVEGDGDEGIDGDGEDPGIIEGVEEPIGEGMAEIKVAIVFEAVDEIADDALGAVAGDGGGEVEGAIGAIGASEGGGDGAVERFGAALAEGIDDGFGLAEAEWAEVVADGGIGAALGAMWGVEERGEGVRGAFEGGDDVHGWCRGG